MTVVHMMPERQPPTDEDLVAALVSGAPDALPEIYARHAPLVFGLAARALDVAAAEDVVQEVFVSLWRHAATFDPARGPVRAWVIRIAQSRIANELRRRRRRPVAAVPDDSAIVNLPDEHPGPPDATWQRYRRDALRAAVDALPAPQRKALGLAFFEDMTHEQVAEVLALPLGTAKTRIRAGIAKLRTRLVEVAAAALVVAVAVVGIRSRLAFERDERALALVTASDAENLRAGAVPGVAPDTHARYRGRPGVPLAVVTLSRFPALPPGRTYQAWVRHGTAWTSLGTIAPDASGAARLIAEDPALATLPEAIRVTVEPAGGSDGPSGPTMVEFPAP